MIEKRPEDPATKPEGAFPDSANAPEKALAAGGVIVNSNLDCYSARCFVVFAGVGVEDEVKL